MAPDRCHQAWNLNELRFASYFTHNICLLLFHISFLVLFALISSAHANSGFQNRVWLLSLSELIRTWTIDSRHHLWMPCGWWRIKNKDQKMPFKRRLAFFYVSNPDWPNCELPLPMFVLPFLWRNVLVAPLLGGPDLWQRLYIVLSKRPWEPTSLWMCLEEHIWPVMSDSVNALGGEKERNKYKFWFSISSAVIIASSLEINSGVATDCCQETIVF